MTDLRHQLSCASRDALLRFLAHSIHAFTIMSRDSDENRKAEINDMVHRLAGHMMALSDHDEPLAEWRLSGILSESEHLSPYFAEKVAGSLP
ncbi:hypothetical protein C7E20_07495 [Sphingobium sp. AEW4]|nr:hypothetical protein C7E20_07495 [Sphingobium sp. AEW4]